MYKLFLSVRYLLKPLSIVAVLALGLSVIALTAAPAVMAGFQADFHARVRGTMSDMSAYSERPLDIERLEIGEKTLASVPGVEAIAPYIEYPAIDRHFDKVDYCFIRAIDPPAEEKVTEFRKFIQSDYDLFLAISEVDTLSPEKKAAILRRATQAHLSQTPEVDRIYRELAHGSEDPDDPSRTLPCVIAGIFYLRQHNMEVGDVVKLTTATETGEVKQDVRFKIVGGFRTGKTQQDTRVLYMGLEAAQDFIGVKNMITGYSLKLVDYNNASKAKEEVRRLARKLMGEDAPVHSCTRPGNVHNRPHSIFPNGMFLPTWEERDENLLKAVGMEKFLIKFITGLIVFAASASIFLVVYMTGQSKIRELGILRALGGSWTGAFQIFLTQASLLASTGLILGSLGGVLFALYINELSDILYKFTGWKAFPPEVYYLERIPALVEPHEILINVGITLGFGLFFAILPSFLAALRPPIRAIRYE